MFLVPRQLAVFKRFREVEVDLSFSQNKNFYVVIISSKSVADSLQNDNDLRLCLYFVMSYFWYYSTQHETAILRVVVIIKYCCRRYVLLLL